MKNKMKQILTVILLFAVLIVNGQQPARHTNGVVYGGYATAPITPKDGQQYYNNVDKKYYKYDGTKWTELNAYKFNTTTTAPTVTDDNTLGYSIFSRWIDTATNKEYVCVDASTGVAVWIEATTQLQGLQEVLEIGDQTTLGFATTGQVYILDVPGDFINDRILLDDYSVEVSGPFGSGNQVEVYSDKILFGKNLKVTRIYPQEPTAAPIDVLLPDESGTLALVSEIPTNADFVDLTTNQTIGGEKSFTEVISTDATIGEIDTKGNTAVITKEYLVDKVKFIDGTNPLNAVYLDGNVGIGTVTPAYKLDIDGNFHITGTSIFHDNIFITKPGGGIVRFTDSNTATFTDIQHVGQKFTISRTGTGGTDLTINSSGDFNIGQQGDVGIDVINPTAKLHSKGTIKHENLTQATKDNTLYIDPTTKEITEGDAPNKHTQGAFVDKLESNYTFDNFLITDNTSNEKLGFLQEVGETIEVSGTTSNNGTFTVASKINDNEISVEETLVTETSTALIKHTLLENGEEKWVEKGENYYLQSVFKAGDRTVSTNQSFNVEIHENGDLEALATGGIITVSEGMVFTFKGPITTAVKFNVLAGADLVIRGTGKYPLTWTGADTFITSVSASMHIERITMIATNGGTFIDVSGDIDIQVVINFCVLIGWNIGNVYNIPTSPIAPQFYMEFSGFFDWASGLNCINTTDIGVTDITLLQLSGVSSNMPFISMTGNVPVGLLSTGTTGSLEDGEHFLSIDPQVSNSSRIMISGQSLSGNYFESNGTTGTFTAVADASITSTSITSITDSGGIARFNYTGSTTYNNQEVVISGFTTNSNYNGTFTIVTTGAGWFEIALPFGSNEAGGSFISNSITLTDTGTSLTDGDTVTITSENVLEYDGGAVVYNKQTNSFQISKVFSSTNSGTWNTSDLDQSDRRVLAFNNPSQASSKYIGAGYMNGNTVSNTAGGFPITNTVYTDIVLGGAGLFKSSNLERWKIIDPVLGIFEYIGNEPFSGFIDYGLTSASVGGSLEFRYKWVVDRGSGYVNLDDDKYIKNIIATIPSNTSDKIPLKIVQGDRVKPQITRMTGGSTHTTEDFSVSITSL